MAASDPRRRSRPVRGSQGGLVLAVVLVSLFAAALFAPIVAAEGRQHRFESDLDTLRVLQNTDGGFGDVVASTGGTSETVRSAESLLESVLAVQLLLAEGEEPLAIHENWEGHQTSLASSSVPSALAWIQRYEATSGAATHPADRAFAAYAYHLLGDEANAQRLAADSIRVYHDEPERFDASQEAKLVYVGRSVDVTIANRTVEPTWLALQGRVAATEGADLATTAWAALAFPSDVSLADDLRDHAEALLADEGRAARAVPTSVLALGTYGLAFTAGSNMSAAEAMHAQLLDRAPLGAARTWALMAEVLVYPYVSTQMPATTDMVGFDVGADGSQRAAAQETVVAVGDADASAAGPDGAASGDTSFPLPTWVVTSTLLLALVALVVVGLAYGLKKEDLQGIRKDVFEYIEAHPGEHFSKIRRELGLASGTFQHHLNVLESEGWITSFKDARYKRYFVNGNRYQTLIKGKTTEEYKGKFAALKNETTREVVRYLHTHPGSTQKQVAERLQLHASTVNWHARRLKQVGILEGEKVGKEVRYRVDTDTVDKLIRE